MDEQLRKHRFSNEIYLLSVLALLFAGIFLTCFYNGTQWIGKPFPGFLLMKNRVVPAAGLPHWTGLQAGKIFMGEVTSVEGRPVSSSEELRDFVHDQEPGTPLRYTFRRGEEEFALTIPVMQFTKRDFMLLFVFYLMNGFAFLLIGFVVRVIRPGNPASLGMFFVGVCSGLWATTGCDLYGPHWFFRIHVFMECFMPAAVVHLSLVFPETSRWVKRHPLLQGVPYLIAGALACLYEGFLYNPGLYVLSHNLATYYFAASMVAMLIMISVWYVKTESMLTKQRIRVLFLGYFAGLFLPALIILGSVYVQGSFSFTLISFFTILWPVSVGYAILKHNFFDIDTVVKRSLYYVSLTTCILTLYLGVLFVLNRLFQGTSFSHSPYFPLAFCLLILLVFNPLKQRLQRTIDRVFFRIRYDYQETVEAVSRAMTSLLDVDEIADTLLSTVTDTMLVSDGVVVLHGTGPDNERVYQRRERTVEVQDEDVRPKSVALLCALDAKPAVLTAYDSEENNALQRYRRDAFPLMSSLELILVIPILFKSKMIGYLGVGTKKSGKTYTRSDLDLLELLANQSSVALSNATSYRELQNLNLNLENVVQERTAELAESNQKLEASYEKLKELDKLKSQFFSNVGHELRTPLTLSLAPLESLLQGEMGMVPSDQKGILSTIHRSALKLLKLVNNLLDFSKIEAGRIRLNIGRHSVVPFLKQIVEPFQLASEKKEIDFHLSWSDCREEELFLYMDRERMEKVFTNLLSNAFKFTPRHGRIQVAVSDHDERVVVKVTDTGPGIPPEDLPRIFERFYQASSKETKRVTGTGIGLSMVKEFTELHGGEVTVESEVGRGTEFIVILRKGRDHLPEELIQEASEEPDGIVSDGLRQTELADLESELEVADVDAEEAEVHRVSQDAPHILVAEDNPEMRRFICMLLKKTYRVTQACDGQEGLEKCREERPDLILSDVTMPRMTGYAFCREVKQDPSLRFIPFVLLTSRAETENRIEGFEAGADEYLAKPFNAKELQARIRSLIELRKAEQELQRTHEELQKTHEELKAAEVQLVQSEKMASLGQLVAGVAHELNNPISFVYGNMNILREYVESIEKILKAFRQVSRDTQYGEELETAWQECDMDFILEDINSLIDGCREGAQRTKQIVMDLRTFSRLDEAERKTIDLHENIRSTLNLLSDQFKDRVCVHTEFGDLPQVECYAGQVSQVFMNLLSNAGHAISEKGDIWIRTKQVGSDEVEIRVEDTGEGIEPDKIEKIFDPFFTTKPVGEGTGLGLSISYGIVQKHGGNISVKSELGKGTCFTVRLPLIAKAEDQGEGHARSDSADIGHVAG